MGHRLNISRDVRLVFGTVLCAGLLATGDGQQRPSTLAPKGLLVQITSSIDGKKLKPGAAVLAKVRAAWDGPKCHLRAGSIVAGHVVEVVPRGTKDAGMSTTIVFDTADCDGKLAVHYPLTIFALMATPEQTDTQLQADRLNKQTFSAPIGGDLAGLSPSLSGMSLPDHDMVGTKGESRHPAPTRVMPGQVYGLKQIQLSVGTGADHGSVLHADGNLYLERDTEFVLMIGDGTSASAEEAGKRAGASAGVVASKAVVAEPIDETEVCSTDCKVVGAAGAGAAGATSSKIPVTALGYVGRDQREITNFVHDVAITYLDAESLLFTFDTHTLRVRGGGRSDSLRTVRAVLIDPKTRAIKKVVDWHVQGEGQYLWPAGAGHVLVHIGRQVRLLDESLSPVRSVPAPGELAWVRVSPNGTRIAVGVLRERHTEAVHQLLMDQTRVQPEEDVEVDVYDEDLKSVLKTTQPTTASAPVLTEAGEVLVKRVAHDRWQLSELRWDRTEHKIAVATSLCKPQVSAPIADHIFVVGCGGPALGRWYRMMRMDGHTVLKGKPASNEIEQAAEIAGRSAFAVRVVRSFKPLSQGSTFRRADLKEEEIATYRANDGDRLFDTTVSGAPIAEQTFAVSPDGRQLAVFRAAEIDLYPLGPPAADKAGAGVASK